MTEFLSRVFWSMAVLSALAGSHAEALFKFRVALRKTALCSELMTTIRASNSFVDSAGLRDELRDFQFNELKRGPVVDALAQPALQVDSSSSEEKRVKLAARVYGIERSFQTPSEDSSVVAYAAIEGDAGIESFTKRLEAAREQIVKDAESDYWKFPLTGAGIRRHFIQVVEYADSPFLAYVAAKFAFVSGVLGTALPYFGSDLKSASIAGAFIVFSAASGMFDYPVRHIRSYELGHKKLSQWLKKFGESQEAWSYWSRDLKLSKQFLQDLNGSPLLSWRSLDGENLRETIPGVFRLLQQRSLSPEIRGDALFSIDALLRRDENGLTRLIVVLRSRPSAKAELQTKSVTSPMAAPQLQ